MGATALHFEFNRRTGLQQRGQQQVQHLAANFDLGAAIGGGADHLAFNHLPRLQGQRLQGAGPRNGYELGELSGN